MNENKGLDAIIAIWMFGFVVYQLYTGTGFGRIRKFTRHEAPFRFFILIAIETFIGIVWLNRALAR